MLFARGRKWCNCFIILNSVTFTCCLSPKLSFHLFRVNPTVKAPLHPEVIPTSVSIAWVVPGRCCVVSLSLGYPFTSINGVMMEIDSTGVTPISVLSPGLFQRVAVTTLGSPRWLVAVTGVDDGGW